jgi:filamentous hemagglutinin
VVQDCLSTPSCQTVDDLNTLRDDQFNAALAKLNNVFNTTIFWVSAAGSLVGGIGSAIAKRVLAGLLGIGGPAAAAEQDPVGVPASAGSAGTVDPKLLEEMSGNGVKFNPQDVLRAGRNADGNIVFLETGNSNAGLEHIVQAHGKDFANIGVSEDQIPDLVIEAATRGKSIGIQGRNRPVYQVDFNGSSYNVAVTVGSNGFIVGANPG